MQNLVPESEIRESIWVYNKLQFIFPVVSFLQNLPNKIRRERQDLCFCPSACFTPLLYSPCENSHIFGRNSLG